MKKIFLSAVIITMTLLCLTACNKGKDALLFKKDYESLNGTTTSNGTEYRKVSISKNNPFIFTDAKDIVNKIESEETFYVYFGSKYCPWCRSVIEKAWKVANDNEIDKVYYVDIWDEDRNEILRDKYTLDDSGKAILVNEGTPEYTNLLKYLDSVLPDYTYAANKNGGNKLDIPEKRIYIPLFVYFVKGKPTRVASGISDLQVKSRDELTQEILNDEEQIFNDFFINICDENC